MSLLSSDGLGHTGAFITIWSLIEQMKAEGQIDVVGTIKSIRKDPETRSSATSGKGKWHT